MTARGLVARWIGVVCLVSLLAAPSVAWAGAWTREQNSFFIAMGYSFAHGAASYTQTGAYFDWRNPRDPVSGLPTGTGLPGARQIEHGLTFYSEYGLIDALTLVLSWDVKWLNKDLGPAFRPESGRSDSNSGIPEIRLGARGRILRAPFVMAMEVQFGIPVQAAYLDPTTFDPQQSVPIGLGTFNATAWVHFAKSWSDFFPSSLLRWWQTYTNFALGFMYRDNFLNSFVFNLEWGSTLFDHLFVGLRYYGDKNVGERRMATGETFGESEQQRWAVSLGFIWGNFTLLGEYSAPTGGRQSLAFRRIGIQLAASY